MVSTNGSDQITISGNMTIGATTTAVTNTANNGADATATISVSNYYSGDTATQTHRVSDNREFTLDLNGIDPAFEKAIRAMGIIAQGDFGTNGGLDQHPERLDQAIYLITSALELTPTGTPPFGAENTSNIRQIEQDLGYQQVLISQTNEQHKDLIAFFDQRVIDTENIDSLEVISRLLDESNALEAAYQAISRDPEPQPDQLPVAPARHSAPRADRCQPSKLSTILKQKIQKEPWFFMVPSTGNTVLTTENELKPVT